VNSHPAVKVGVLQSVDQRKTSSRGWLPALGKPSCIRRDRGWGRKGSVLVRIGFRSAL